MLMKDRIALAGWLASNASLPEVRRISALGFVDNERFTPTAVRAFKLLWAWSAPRAEGDIGRRQQVLEAKHGPAFLQRRFERAMRMIDRLCREEGAPAPKRELTPVAASDPSAKDYPRLRACLEHLVRAIHAEAPNRVSAYLNEAAQQAEALIAQTPSEPPAPRIVIDCAGGVVQAVIAEASGAVEVVLCDHDEAEEPGGNANRGRMNLLVDPGAVSSHYRDADEQEEQEAEMPPDAPRG